MFLIALTARNVWIVPLLFVFALTALASGCQQDYFEKVDKTHQR